MHGRLENTPEAASMKLGGFGVDSRTQWMNTLQQSVRKQTNHIRQLIDILVIGVIPKLWNR